MAWRPHNQLIFGEFDNTQPGNVIGWMHFRGIKPLVVVHLEGDFHRDIRGARLRIWGTPPDSPDDGDLEGFAHIQSGKVGDITAGLEPVDYVDYPYIEWYSEEAGRVVIELPPENVRIIGTPLPWRETAPVCRKQQHENLLDFMATFSHVVREDGSTH